MVTAPSAEGWMKKLEMPSALDPVPTAIQIDEEETHVRMG
jgi:hypothetical protein